MEVRHVAVFFILLNCLFLMESYWIAEEDVSLDSWFQYSHVDEVLTRELTSQSADLLGKRHALVSLIGTDRSLWISRQNEVYTKFSSLFQPMLCNTSYVPRMVVTETLKRDGFVVKKMYYESKPQFFVTGALYIPDGVESGGNKAPGILFASGHAMNGFRSSSEDEDDYQVVQLNLVHRGYVVLSFDPIGQGERSQYYDVDSKKDLHKSCTYQHEYLGRQLQLVGVQAMSFWLWDSQVSLNILASLPYVNEDMLGVVGCSGGGTQASYLGAMDERIKAASIACYMSTLLTDRNHVRGGGNDGEQTWAHGISMGLDKPDLVEMRAPKATQVLITSNDECFPAQGGHEAVDEARNVFIAFSAEEKLDVHEAIYHHGWVKSNREAIYGFFCRELDPTGNGKICDEGEIPIVEFSEKELTVTETGQVTTDPNIKSKTVWDFTREFGKNSLDRLARRRANDSLGFLKEVKSAAPEISGFYPPAPTVSVQFIGAELIDYGLGIKKKFVISGEGSSVVSLSVHIPTTNITASFEAVLYYAREHDEVVSQVVSALLNRGYLVIVPDLPGFGELGDAFTGSFGKGQGGAVHMAHEIGRSIPGVHAGEMVRVGRWLLSSSMLDISRIAGTIVADHTDTALLHAAVITDSDSDSDSDYFGNIVLLEPVAGLQSNVLSRFFSVDTYHSWVFDILNHYDKPDLIACLAPRQVLVVGPKDSELDYLSKTDIQSQFNFTTQIYMETSPGHFHIHPGALSTNDLVSLIMDWVGLKLKLKIT